MARRARWLPLLALPLFALLLSTPAWAVWHDSDIENAFAKMDKKLLKIAGDLARKDKITVRRVTELEHSVRELRATLHRLELRLDTLNSNLAGLRTDLKSAAKATAAGTGTDNGAASSSAEPKGPVTEILSERRTVNGDFITLTGLVHNLSDKSLTFFVVKASFLDEHGAIVKTESNYTDPPIVAPGAKATFKFVTRYDRRIRKHKLSVQTK